MRTCHGRALHHAVFVVRQCAYDLIAFFCVPSRSDYVGPVSVIGIIGPFIIRPYGRDGHYRFVFGRIAETGVVIACGENHKPSYHRACLHPVFVDAGVSDEVIRRILEILRSICGIGIAPAVLRNHGTVVCAPFDGFGPVCTVFALEYLTRHEFHTGLSRGGIASGHSADSDAVVVHCGYRTCHVCAVVICRHFRAAGHEIESEPSLSCLFRVFPHVGRKVLVVEVDTSVHHAYNHVGVAGGVSLPYRNHVDVAAADGTVCRTVVVIMPLVAEHRVVEYRIFSTYGPGRVNVLYRSFTAYAHDSVRDFDGFDSRKGQCGSCRLGGDRLVVADDIPFVQSGFPCPRLEFPGVGEKPFHGCDFQRYGVCGQGFNFRQLYIAFFVGGVFDFRGKSVGYLDNEFARNRVRSIVRDGLFFRFLRKAEVVVGAAPYGQKA